MVGVPGRINHKDRQRTMCDRMCVTRPSRTHTREPTQRQEPYQALKVLPKASLILSPQLAGQPRAILFARVILSAAAT